MVIHNHPYDGSRHSPDIAIVILVFHKGERVAFSASTAHDLDIGAATPGLLIGIPDVYADGMLFAGTKHYEGAAATRRCGRMAGRECGISTSLTLGSAQEWSNRTSRRISMTVLGVGGFDSEKAQDWQVVSPAFPVRPEYRALPVSTRWRTRSASSSWSLSRSDGRHSPARPEPRRSCRR